MCKDSMNNGYFYYIPFCGDGSSSFDGNFNGAYSFKNGDSKLYFTPNFNSSALMLNIMFLVPAMLEVYKDDIVEIIP